MTIATMFDTCDRRDTRGVANPATMAHLAHAQSAPSPLTPPPLTPHGPTDDLCAPAPAMTTAWIGAGPGLNEPAGFAVDLDRVLNLLPRHNFPPRIVTGPPPRSWRTRGRARWSGVPFAGMGWPSVSRIWSRDKGRRR
jgi:hypothetical protein